MHRNKKLLVVLFALVLASLACGGTEGATPEAAPNTNVSDSEPAPTTVPEDLKDVAVMQGTIVVHKELGYVMSEQGLPQSILDKRATCFTALSKGESSDSCSANLKAEFGRMPGVCTCSPEAEAPGKGICTYVAK